MRLGMMRHDPSEVLNKEAVVRNKKNQESKNTLDFAFVQKLSPYRNAVYADGTTEPRLKVFGRLLRGFRLRDGFCHKQAN